MLELQIDAELKSWIDPLSADEYALLEASIVEEGCRDPLVVWAGYLLDGHNRYEICHKHGVEFATFEKSGLATKEDVKIWMIQNQIGKRNTTDFTRTALALKLKPLIDQRAQQRMLAGRPSTDPVQNSAQGTGKARDELAKVAGVSHDTVRKVERIIQSATAEVIAQVRTGEISIHAAAKTVAPPKPPTPTVATPRPPEPAPTMIEAALPPADDPTEFGPSRDEIAAAERAEAEQLEYIKNLLASEDDPLAKALADLKQKALEISVLRSQNAGHQNKINEQIRMIKSLRSKLAKLEAK